MRQIVKASGSGGFTIGGSDTSTPKKAKKTATPVETPGSKRKRSGKAGTSADDNENITPLKNEENATSLVKMEAAEDEIDTPTKKKPLHPTLSGNQVQVQSGRHAGACREMAYSSTSQILVKHSSENATMDNRWPTLQTRSEVYHTDDFLLLVIIKNSLYDNKLISACPVLPRLIELSCRHLECSVGGGAR